MPLQFALEALKAVVWKNKTITAKVSSTQLFSSSKTCGTPNLKEKTSVHLPSVKIS